MPLTEAQFNVAVISTFPPFAVLAYYLVPPKQREVASRTTEVLRISRTTCYSAAVLLLVGWYVPAYLGWAPLYSRGALTFGRLAVLLYPAFYGAGIVLGAVWFSAYRTRRRYGRARKTRLESPPSPGLALVAGTAEPSEAGPESVPGAGAGTLLYDYRLPEESMPREDGPWSSDDGDLAGSVPFRVTGPGGSIRVDPSEANLGIDEREAEDCRIEAGDSVTVFGSVRRTDGDELAMAGDDVLYVTNRTPDEWMLDLGLAYYVTAAASVFLLIAAFGILFGIAA